MYFLLKGANKNVTNEMLSQIKTYNKQLNQLTSDDISCYDDHELYSLEIQRFGNVLHVWFISVSFLASGLL